MNEGLIIGVGIGAAALSAGYIAWKLKQAGNTLEVVDVSYDRVKHTLDVEVSNTGKKAYRIEKSTVRQLSSFDGEPAKGDTPMMAARGASRSMFNLLSEREDQVLINPGETKVITYEILLPEEALDFDLDRDIELSVEGEEVDIQEPTAETTSKPSPEEGVEGISGGNVKSILEPIADLLESDVKPSADTEDVIRSVDNILDSYRSDFRYIVDRMCRDHNPAGGSLRLISRGEYNDKFRQGLSVKLEVCVVDRPMKPVDGPKLPAPMVETLELKEILFTSGIETDVDGRCFTIDRVRGDILSERKLGDRYLVEIKYKSVYGAFTDGMYHHKDRWIEGEGIILIKPDVIKSVMIKTPPVDTV